MSLFLSRNNDLMSVRRNNLVQNAITQLHFTSLASHEILQLWSLRPIIKSSDSFEWKQPQMAENH